MSIDSTPVPPRDGHPDTTPRFGAPQAFTAVSFPVLGAALHLTGTPIKDIFALLSGCGGREVGGARKWDAEKDRSTTAGPRVAGCPNTCAAGGSRPG